jgi:hypothetical protein
MSCSTAAASCSPTTSCPAPGTRPGAGQLLDGGHRRRRASAPARSSNPADGGGTHVRLVHPGPSEPAIPIHDRGWDAQMRNLADALATHAKQGGER